MIWHGFMLLFMLLYSFCLIFNTIPLIIGRFSRSGVKYEVIMYAELSEMVSEGS